MNTETEVEGLEIKPVGNGFRVVHSATRYYVSETFKTRTQAVQWVDKVKNVLVWKESIGGMLMADPNCHAKLREFGLID